MYTQRQDEDLDLTCVLELQHKTCDARNVVIHGGEIIKLVDIPEQESVTCLSSDAIFNVGDSSATCAPYARNRPFRGAGIATGIFLHHVRGSNKMVITSDFSPISPSSLDAGSKPHDAFLRIEILPGEFTGMVHYDRFVEIYFNNLPLCSSQLTWPSHAAARTFVTARRICPCKARQSNRGTFVYLHAVEFGIDFSDQTVVVFYKTPDGRNRLADLRTGKNAAVIDLITETEDFDVRGVTEMQLLRHTDNFEKSDSTMRWVGDIFQYQPPQPSKHYNVTITEPKLHTGSFPVNHTLLYPTTDILLRFPGVYTITEHTLKLRRNGKMLSSRSKRYVHVKKRIAPINPITAASILRQTPLRYVTLIDIMAQPLPRIIYATSFVTQGRENETQTLNTQLDKNNSFAWREQYVWDYISTRTQRSCRELTLSLANVVGIQAQYIQLVRLLLRDGPCAPGITGYDFLQNPDAENTAVDRECVLTASTTTSTGRHALMAIQRQYIGRDPGNRFAIYNYSAQFLSPVSVPFLMTATSATSFCNVKNIIYSPHLTENRISHTVMWTQRQAYPVETSLQHRQMSEQIIQSGWCV